MAGNGGKRPGAGRKKGCVAAHTLEASKMREYLIERVRQEMDALLEAKFALAKGHYFLGDDGKVYTKSPDSNSIQYLLNQSIGKPKETVEHSGSLEFIFDEAIVE